MPKRSIHEQNYLVVLRILQKVTGRLDVPVNELESEFLVEELGEDITKPKQRQPREDWKRDHDSVRRYEIAADIDGDNVVVHIDGNVLTFHEKSDTEFKSPKFKFVFRDSQDLAVFCLKVATLGVNVPLLPELAIEMLKFKGRGKASKLLFQNDLIVAINEWQNRPFTYADEELSSLINLAIKTLLLAECLNRKGDSG
jgi:hypothetical protein